MDKDILDLLRKLPSGTIIQDPYFKLFNYLQAQGYFDEYMKDGLIDLSKLEKKLIDLSKLEKKENLK